MQIPFQRLNPLALPPTQAHSTDAGYDLFALPDSADHDYSALLPGWRRAIRTGIAVAIPPGYYGRIAPRSGLAARCGIDVLAGVIDSSFRGELKVILINLGQDPVWFNPGDRIAQLIIESCANATFVETETLDETARAAAGFGSTGS